MRCVCVTPNASVDTTYRVDRLSRGSTIRVADRASVPGGKGNNVARVLRALGHEVVATGFAAGATGKLIEAGLRELGVEPAFVGVAGESRTCLAILEREEPVVTELLEPGPRVTLADVGALVERVAELGPEADAIVLSGSLPTAGSPDLYAQIIRAVRRSPVFVALDSSGAALLEGLQAGPDLVKPNWEEMTALAGRRQLDLDDAVRFAQTRLLGGPLPAGASVLLSLGENGAVLISAEGAVRLPAPAAEAINPVGAGDAMLAGYLDAWARGERGEAALRWASAVAGASTRAAVPGSVEAFEIEPLAQATGAAIQLDIQQATNRGDA